MAKKANTSAGLNIEKWYPRLLAVFSCVGFTASFILTLEKFALLKDPQHRLSCSLNPILSCGPIINSPQASAFGFPNPIIGLFSFSVLFAVSMGILAGTTVSAKVRWYWRLFVFGHLFGLGFIAWLFYQSLYVIGALCIYCMVAWAVTIALNWYGLLWLGSTGRLRLSGAIEKFRLWGIKNHVGFLFLCYLTVFGFILFRFRDYFESVLF